MGKLKKLNKRVSNNVLLSDKVITIDTVSAEISRIKGKPLTRERIAKIAKLKALWYSMLPQQKLRNIEIVDNYTVGTYTGTGHPQTIIQ